MIQIHKVSKSFWKNDTYRLARCNLQLVKLQYGWSITKHNKTRHACKCMAGSLEKRFCSEDESWPCLKFGEHFTHHRAIQSNHRQDEEVKKRFSWLNFQNWSWQPAYFEKLCVRADLIHSFHSLDWKKTGSWVWCSSSHSCSLDCSACPSPSQFPCRTLNGTTSEKSNWTVRRLKLGLIPQPIWNDQAEIIFYPNRTYFVNKGNRIEFYHTVLYWSWIKRLPVHILSKTLLR